MTASIGIILAQAASETAPEPFDWLGTAVCAAGLTLLMLWLKFYGGSKALAAAPIRRHRISPAIPFLLFFVWVLMMSLAVGAAEKLAGKDNAAVQETLQNLLTLIVNLLMIAALLITARRLFARRLKGFGLNPKTLPQDLGWAVVNLAAVYPIIVGGVLLVLALGRLIKGDGFEIQTHQSLEELITSSRIGFRILMIVLVVGVVPVMEEMLFRGFLQSSLRALLPGVWPAVLVTSGLFAAVHYSTHFLSIFALSCALGYAYERSGSLFRSIAIHALFNASSVAAALLM